MTFKKNLSTICGYTKEKTDVLSLNHKTYISTENMLPNKGGITPAATLPNAKLTQAFKTNDILVSNIRPYFKKIWYATFNGGCSNDVLVFRAKQGVSSKFLYYVLANDDFFNYSMTNSKGTKMPRGDRNSIMKYEVPDIDFLTQQKIARVLSAIDDKIELNNSINSNLEQQAYLMYQNIFGSCEQSIIISDLIDIRDGTHDSPKPQDFGYKLITSKHLKSYGVNDISSNYISDADYNKINERSQVETNDILISMIGTVGIVSLIIENPVEFAVKNVGIFKTSVSPTLIYYVLNYLKSLKTQNYILSHLAGTTQKYISLGELRNLNICKPNEKSLKSFNTVAKPLYDQIINNINENKTLAQLRDTLLPKLMNGEIDVSNVPSLRGMK